MVIAAGVLIVADRACPADLPSPLVYLADVAPAIRQDMRYATPRNFTRAIVPGYEAGECILTRAAAEALLRVQADLAKRSLGLKVYDCYRPERAVRAFVAWANGAGKVSVDSAYFPNVMRRSLIAEGYIAARSGHSTGTAIDLTLVALAPAAATPVAPAVADAPAENAAAAESHSGTCTAPASQREADDSLDMGTGYDCFDPKSHTAAAGLPQDQKSMRATLVAAMSAQGFTNYPREWWHFSYPHGNGAAFDVPVRPRKAAP